MELETYIRTTQEMAMRIVDDAMRKRDRSVSIYVSPDGGCSVSVYPWPDDAHDEV